MRGAQKAGTVAAGAGINRNGVNPKRTLAASLISEKINYVMRPISGCRISWRIGGTRGQDNIRQ